MPAYQVSIIIPVHNRWDLTRQCLETLRQVTPLDSVQIIVVDNGSTDATPSLCNDFGNSLFKGRFQNPRLDNNMGFAKACNMGTRHSDARHLFFLNNDTLPQPGWLPPLLQAMEGAPDLGAVAPLLLYPGNKTVQHAGTVFDCDLSVEHLFEHFPGHHPLARALRFCQALTAAALLMSTDLFLKCGGFYQGYTNGYEDMDLCCAIRDHGKTLRMVPESVILHYASQTLGRFDHETENIALLHKRKPDGFVPDLHTHAREAGYEMTLTPWLTSRMSLQREREPEFMSRLRKPFDPGQCFELLEGEPLWNTGYDLLADFLEKNELWAETVELLFRQAFLCPDERVYRRLLRASLKSGNTEMSQECQRRLESVNTLLSAPDELKKKALELQQRMSRVAPDMATLYGDFAKKI